MTEHKLNITLEIWKAFYQSKGLEQAFITECLNYARVLLKQDLPVIFDLNHLSVLLALDKDYLYSTIYGSAAHYRTFQIPKKKGGYRELSAPHHTLKYIQTWIYTNVLSKVKINYCSHGFCPKKSIITNAKVHVDNQSLLKIDLKDFFCTITINQVITVFKNLGYAPKVAFYLASLCCLNNTLPQGAPTSPSLSNIVAKQMDYRLLKLCKKLGFKYSRYADDMAFSGTKITPDFADYVKKIINNCGFVVNENKVKLYKGEGAKILTGLSLSNNQIRVPREYRRTLEMELYYIKKYGLGEHMRRKRIKNPNYLESMIGKVEYWLMVEPDNKRVKSYREYLEILFREKIAK